MQKVIPTAIKEKLVSLAQEFTQVVGRLIVQLLMQTTWGRSLLFGFKQELTIGETSLQLVQ